jgi:two-component system LytT family response regulator
MPDELSVLIIEDGKQSAKQLNEILSHDAGIIIKKVQAESLSIEDILQESPDLVFLETTQNNGSGIEILDHLLSLEPRPEIVLLIDNSTDSVRYFRSGLLYILNSPYRLKEVHDVFREFRAKRSHEIMYAGMNRLVSGLVPKKLKFSTRKGHVFLDADEIIYCKADSNYTHLMLTGHRQITVSKSLHHFDNQVLSPNYFRISRSAIINTEYLVEINRNEKKCVLKVNDSNVSLPVTQKYLKVLLDHHCNCYLQNQ